MLYGRMQEAGVRADFITFNILLGACEKVGDAARAMEVYGKEEGGREGGREGGPQLLRCNGHIRCGPG